MRRRDRNRSRRKHTAKIWRIAGVLTLIAAEALLYGYSYPFFSLALEKRELANWLIGLNASLASAGILFVGPFLPRLIHRIGLKYVVAAMFAVSFLSFGAILVADHLAMWFAARFVMGTCFAALWTTTEIWLNGVVDDRQRGRIIGASGTLYATCQFIGPLVLGGVGVTGSLPLIVAMVPLAIGVAVSLSISPADESTEDEDSVGETRSLKLAFAVAGGLVATAFLAGVGETAMQSLLPLYGIAHDFGDAGAARLVAIFSLGEAVLVAGLGWMADRYGRQFTLRICVIVATVTTFAIPLSVDQAVILWPLLFFAGGTVAGIYTLGIILIGQDFRGQTLAVVSTGFAMAYSAGSIVGSAPIGYLIDLFGPEALPVSVAIGFLGLTIYLFIDSGEPRQKMRQPMAPPPVPNLTYLDDTGFDEDETAPSSVATEDKQAPVSSPSPFRPPQHHSPSSSRSLVKADEKYAPDVDLDLLFQQRATDIAAAIARRHKPKAPAAPEHAEAPAPQPPNPFRPR